MKRILFSLIALLFMPATSFALNLEIDNEVGITNKQLIYPIITHNSYGDISYAMHSSNIGEYDWKIEDGKFIWTPRKAGFYTATFSAIDEKNGFDEETVIFSVVNPLKPTTINYYKSPVKTISETTTEVDWARIQKNSRIIKYIKKDQNIPEKIYQPISLYYTRGFLPSETSLVRAGQGIELQCRTGSKFVKRRYTPYTGKIQPPTWISQLNAENRFEFNAPNNAKAFALVDLPDDVEMIGCNFYTDTQVSSGYRLYYPATGVMTDPRKFVNGQKISTRSSMLIIFTDDYPQVTKEVETNAVDRSNVGLTSDTAYQYSLFNSELPSSFVRRMDEKEVFTREEMAHMVIYILSNSGSRAKTEARKKRAYYGFKDVLRSPYQGEIFLFEKLGFDKGIRDDFMPSKIATVEDFYFALAKPLGVDVDWWQKNELFEAMKALGLVEKKSEMKEGLNFRNAARAILLTQEVLTKRGINKIDRKDPLVIEYKNRGALDDTIINNSYKSSGVTREDFLRVLFDSVVSEFDVFSVYQKLYDKRTARHVVFENVAKGEDFAPYIAYAVEKNILPQSWMQLEEFQHDVQVTRGEALAMLLKTIKEEDEAQEYFKDKVKSCFSDNGWKKTTNCKRFKLQDLEGDRELAEENLGAFYAKTQGIIGHYQDRFDNNLFLFVPEKRASLIEVLEMIDGAKNL